METEIQLYIEGDKYMVADVLLFKRNGRGDIIDVILIENKFSSTTRFTSNQSEMFRNLQNTKRLEVKTRSRSRETIEQDEIITLSSTQLIEVRGNRDANGVNEVTLGIIK